MDINQVNKREKDFIRDCAENFDCDNDAHVFGTLCRKCEAKEILFLKDQYNREARKSYSQWCKDNGQWP